VTAYDEVLGKIHLGNNPYIGFPVGAWSGIWYGDPGAQRDIFKTCIARLKPRIIVEVGSFVGESSIFMAKEIKAQKMDTAIIAVDTWYAGIDHWNGAREKIKPHFGRPDLYYRFVANVIVHGCQDVIVPLATDSINGARILEFLGIAPDLVYVDASHENEDALRDYESYWRVLKSNGGMLCDDVSGHFPGVVEAVARFSGTMAIKPNMVEGEKVLLIKP